MRVVGVSVEPGLHGRTRVSSYVGVACAYLFLHVLRRERADIFDDMWLKFSRASDKRCPSHFVCYELYL